MLNRAYSVLELKAVDDDQRVINGVATTPSPDRIGDIVEPEGAVYKLPIPLLAQHDSRRPIGHVTKAKVTGAGIEIEARLVKFEEAGPLKERLDLAWQEIKAGLVRGLSIGFNPLESVRIEGTWSFRYPKWEWLELSAVTIPANADATIQAVKSIDGTLRDAVEAGLLTVNAARTALGLAPLPEPAPAPAAATGKSARVVRLNPPPASRPPFIIRSIKRI